MDKNFVPFAATPKTATALQRQHAWENIHLCLRNSATALLFQSLLLSTSAWWIYRQMQIHHGASNQEKINTIFLALCTGAGIFGTFAIHIFRLYPQPTTFPPNISLKRVQTGRILMVFFGAGYIVRGIDLLKKTGTAKSHNDVEENDLLKNNYMDSESISNQIQSTGFDTSYLVENLRKNGSLEACLVFSVGAIGVVLSYWIGKQMRSLKTSLQFTKKHI
mmetsp:Transcript_12224/g.14760  ORF Transcript_12224/g.14760 Transcript_12224/m.14760 type:complete len:220 (+) Transcript_12224:3-662(+)